jgi:hypothetical protein
VVDKTRHFLQVWGVRRSGSPARWTTVSVGEGGIRRQQICFSSQAHRGSPQETVVRNRFADEAIGAGFFYSPDFLSWNIFGREKKLPEISGDKNFLSKNFKD